MKPIYTCRKKGCRKYGRDEVITNIHQILRVQDLVLCGSCGWPMRFIRSSGSR